MSPLANSVSIVVFAGVGGILAATFLLIATALVRRWQRERHFQLLDQLRSEHSPVMLALLEGRLDYQEGLAALRRVRGRDRTAVLENLCLSHSAVPGRQVTLARLCEDLGLVAAWQATLQPGNGSATRRQQGLLRDHLESLEPLQFLARARAAENLGLIRHRPSWPLLVNALNDRHPDVQWVAARALGSLAEPSSFPPLVRRLHDIVTGPSTRLSLRSVKAALVCFPLRHSALLRESLEHPAPRMRFLAVDVIREMVGLAASSKEDFTLGPPDFAGTLSELFLSRLSGDENPDVRARSAPVIAYLPDRRAAAVLVALAEDSAWFVRLHAVRALGKERFRRLAPQVACRLTDSNWRVREAAAATLVAMGQVGINCLLEHFLTSDYRQEPTEKPATDSAPLPDLYSREQIAEKMQLAGLGEILRSFCAAKLQRGEAAPIEQLIRAGKGAFLTKVLSIAPSEFAPPELRPDFTADSSLEGRALTKPLTQ